MMLRNGMWQAGEFKLRAPLTRLLIERLRHEKLEYLDQNATADALGCSFAMFKQLQRDSILRPEEGDRHRMRKGYHRASLRLFLERLGAGTERVSAPGPHLCKLDLVTRKANCSVPVLVKLILDGKLRTSARLTDELRLDTLLVNPVDVMRALRLAEPNGFSRSEVKRRLFINAATLDFLIKRRMLEVRRQRHSITRVTRSYITGESMARFKDEFVTPGMFAQENSLSSQRAAKLLRDGKASPIEAKGGIRRIYARRDL